MKLIKTKNVIVNAALMTSCSLHGENQIRCDMVDGDTFYSGTFTPGDALTVLDLLVDFLTHDSDGCFDLGGN